MRIVSASLALALLAFPATAQTMVIPDENGGGWVYGSTSQTSGFLTPDYGGGQKIMTPQGSSTIHPDGTGGRIVVNDRTGRTSIMLPDYGAGHMILSTPTE